MKMRFATYLVALCMSALANQVCALPWEEATPNFTIDCCGEVTYFGEGLYWTACSDGYFFTIARVGEVFSVTNIVIEEQNAVFSSDFRYKIHKASHKADAGFRLGVSYLCPVAYWETSLSWLHYCIDNTRNFSSKDPSLIPFSTFRPSRDGFAYSDRSDIFPDLVAEKVKGKWELNIESVDLTFGYPTNWCECIDLRPHMDLRFICLEQKLKIDAEGEMLDLFTSTNQFIETGTFLADFQSHETLDLDYWGVGPRFGIDLDWEIQCGFGLYGNVAGSLVYGEHDATASLKLKRINTAIERNIEPDDPLPVDLKLTHDRHGSRWCSRAILDLNLGLFWHLAPCQCPFAMIVKLGWEQHQFYNLGMGDVDAAARGYISREGNDLSTQGLNVSFQMIF